MGEKYHGQQRQKLEMERKEEARNLKYSFGCQGIAVQLQLRRFTERYGFSISVALTFSLYLCLIET